ncbi:MAG: hypothetical protein PHV21_06020 [Synergistaceae bacterium]|jgi:hypothetical protein|nr:hypothetical protein [Synergistaceae bacterium]
MIDGARLAEYIELTARKRALDDDLKELNERLVLIEMELLDQFEAAGVDKIGKDGYTLYMARSLRPRAKDGDRERMLEAIKANGYGDLVKEDIHPKRLEAIVRELDGQGEMPDWAKGTIEIYEQYNIRVRKGSM